MNKFYHLHIPKTGGTSLNLFLNNTIYPILQNNNIQIFPYSFNKSVKPVGHFGWQPVNENTYVFSSMRDPIKRLVSQFVFIKHFNNQYELANKNNFLNWVENNSEVLSNYQLKNLFYDKNTAIIPEVLSDNSAPININLLPLEEIKQNLLRINIFIKTENINYNNLEIIYKKILKDFNINNTIKYSYKEKEKVYTFERSTLIYNLLTEYEKNFILDLNKEESEIYNTKKYFTQFDNTPQ